jgi:hypothetical protein
MSRLHAAERLIVLSLVLGVHPGYTQFGRLSPGQLEDLVARIALYPDPLLAQILAASTYWPEIPQAAAWARQHSYLTAEALAEAIREDNLPWHPSVIALLPFPSALEVMAQDPAWLHQLGTAVLTQPDEVMDAIQRLRRKALQFGYLRSNNYITVNVTPENIEILPATPGVIYVPTYDPLVLFAAPTSGVVVGEAIRFRPAVRIGAAFGAWGWTAPAIRWRAHSIMLDRPWERRWAGREHYVHPYFHPWVPRVGPRVEHHEIRRR